MKFNWFKFDYNKKRDPYEDGSWMYEREDEGPPSGNAEGRSLDILRVVHWVVSITKRFFK